MEFRRIIIIREESDMLESLMSLFKCP